MTNRIHSITPLMRFDENKATLTATMMRGSQLRKHIKHAIAVASAFVGVAAAADVQYLWWEVKTSPVWKDAAGNTVTWTNGNDAVWKSVWSGNATPTATWDMNSLTFDTATYRDNFWVDGGYYNIGAGGLTFAQRGFFPVGKNYATDRRVKLTASQEWRGTQTGTARSDVSIGYMGYGAYYKMRLAVTADVKWWKLSGLLNVWIGGQNDQLGNVDVTVEAPSKLMLVDQYMRSSSIYDCDARLGAKKLILKGDGFQLATGPASYPYPNGTYNLSCINKFDATHLAPALELVDGADLALTNGLFAIPSVAVKGSGTSDVIGSFSNNLATTSVAFSDGATLFLDAVIADGVAGPSAISATGYGTLKIDTSKYEATGAVTLGADTTLSLAGVGAPSFQFSGGSAIELDIGAGKTNYLSNAELAAYTGRPVKVKSGTLVLQSADSLPAGLSVVEDGGVVVYAASCPLVVTDAVRQEASITVNAGEEMLVFGNGLTSSTALTLAGGTVRFMRTATIASPVTVSADGGAVRICTDDSDVYGTVSGAISAAADVRLFGMGWIELAGGATFSGTTSLRAYEGYVKLSNGDYAFGTGELFIGTAIAAATNQVWVGEWCRRFVVGNGANVTFTPHNTGATYIHIKVHPLPDVSDYMRESVLEIAEGGSVTLPNTSDISLGNNQNIGTLHINGGTFRTGAWGRIRLGDGAYATGRLIIDAGTLRPGGYIGRGVATGMGYITWNGGTIRVDDVWTDGNARLINPIAAIQGDTMRLSVNVAGEDCVLDLTGCRHASMANMPAQFNGMFNEWWGHGRLTVKGGKNFVMTSIPDGLRLRLEGDGTTVTLPTDGKVYDYDTCLVNCQWRRPYENGAPSKYNVTNSWLSSMTFANVTFAGTNCSFVCAREETPTSATNVTVATTGVSGLVEALPDDIALRDVMFENGATWKLGSSVLDVAGSLAFCDSLLISAAGLPRSNQRQKVAQAAGGVFGKPLVGVVGPRKNTRLSFEANAVFAYPAGMVVSFY